MKYILGISSGVSKQYDPFLIIGMINNSINNIMYILLYNEKIYDSLVGILKKKNLMKINFIKLLNVSKDP